MDIEPLNMRWGVKPLEWRTPANHPQDHDDCDLVANGVGGRYGIASEGATYLLWGATDNFIFTEHPTIEDAKAAAQADYEACILSVLVVEHNKNTT